MEDSERAIAWAARQKEAAAREKEDAAVASVCAARAASENAAREKEAAAAALARAVCTARAASENAAREKEDAAEALARAVDDASLREATAVQHERDEHQHERDEHNSRSLSSVLRFVTPNGGAEALLGTRSFDALTTSNAALAPSSRRNRDYKRASAAAFDGLVDLLSGNDGVRAEVVLASLTEHISHRRKEQSRDVRALDKATQWRTLFFHRFKASGVARWLRLVTFLFVNGQLNTS